MNTPKLPHRKSYNWFLWWRENRFFIMLILIQFAVLAALWCIYIPQDMWIRFGEPVKTKPAITLILEHDEAFEKAMLEIIERDDKSEKGVSRKKNEGR